MVARKEGPGTAYFYYFIVYIHPAITCKPTVGVGVYTFLLLMS